MISDAAGPSSRPLIVTKVRPPRRQRGLLRRERLIEYLSDNIHRKLVLVSAPPGYGKTSLLVDYVEETDFPVCWYRVDESDADPAAFFEYCISSLRQRYPEAGGRTLAMLRAQPPLDIEAVVGSLVNEIHEQVGEFFLFILDDYQKLDGANLVNVAVDALLNYLPDNCQVVVSSRTLPKKLTLTRLAAKGQVVGVGQEQLRFSPEEIRELVRLQSGRELSDEDCDALAGQSEGWITALVIGGDRLLSDAFHLRPHAVGDHSQLFDFLAQEVFDHQPDEVREFLLRTSILEGLTPDLCNAVLTRDDSAQMLRRIDEENLFLMPIEAEGVWYRYHQLFHDFLAERLRAADRPDTPDLHRRAAAWYAAARQPELEIRHLLTAGDFEVAAGRMGEVVEDAVALGRFHMISSWVSALPEDIQRDRPDLLHHQAGAYVNTGNLAESLAIYNTVIEAATAKGDDAILAKALAGRAYSLRFLGQIDASIADSKRALELNEGVSKQVDGNAHRNLGACYAVRGDTATAALEFAAALESFEEARLISDAASTHADLSAMCQVSGDVEQSLVHAEAARRHWEESGNITGLARVLNNMATAYHAQGLFEDARFWLEEAVAKARLAGVRRVEALALVGLGDVEADQDDFEPAIEHYQKGLELARAVGEGTLVCYALAACAEVLRLSDRLLEASQHLAQAREELSVHRSAFEAALVDYARGTFALQRRQHEPAKEHLEDAARGFGALGSKREEARALLYRCAVAHRLEDEPGVRSWWHQAQEAMEDFGYSESFAPCRRRLPEIFGPGQVGEADAAAAAQHETVAVEPTARPSGGQREESATGAEAERLAVLAFGAPEVCVDGEVLGQKDWQTLTARDMFFYLVDRPEGASRDELMHVFWPNSSAVRARSSLHSTFYRVRRALGRNVIASDAERYFIDTPEDLHYDVVRFEDHLRRAKTGGDDESMAELEAAVGLVRGPYLEGVAAEWCHSRREELDLRITEAILALADARDRVGDHALAIADYQRALEWDQLREDTHRGLIRAYAASGDRARALRQYERLADVLESELDVEPDPETVALFNAIRDERELPPAT